MAITNKGVSHVKQSESSISDWSWRFNRSKFYGHV